MRVHRIAGVPVCNKSAAQWIERQRIAGVPVCNKSAAQWIERQRIAGVPPALLIEPVLRSNAVLLRAKHLGVALHCDSAHRVAALAFDRIDRSTSRVSGGRI